MNSIANLRPAIEYCISLSNCTRSGMDPAKESYMRALTQYKKEYELRKIKDRKKDPERARQRERIRRLLAAK